MDRPNRVIAVVPPGNDAIAAAIRSAIEEDEPGIIVHIGDSLTEAVSLAASDRGSPHDYSTLLLAGVDDAGSQKERKDEITQLRNSSPPYTWPVNSTATVFVCDSSKTEVIGELAREVNRFRAAVRDLPPPLPQ